MSFDTGKTKITKSTYEIINNSNISNNLKEELYQSISAFKTEILTTINESKVNNLEILSHITNQLDILNSTQQSQDQVESNQTSINKSIIKKQANESLGAPSKHWEISEIFIQDYIKSQLSLYDKKLEQLPWNLSQKYEEVKLENAKYAVDLVTYAREVKSLYDNMVNLYSNTNNKIINIENENNIFKERYCEWDNHRHILEGIQTCIADIKKTEGNSNKERQEISMKINKWISEYGDLKKEINQIKEVVLIKKVNKNDYMNSKTQTQDNPKEYEKELSSSDTKLNEYKRNYNLDLDNNQTLLNHNIKNLIHNETSEINIKLDQLESNISDIQTTIISLNHTLSGVESPINLTDQIKTEISALKYNNQITNCILKKYDKDLQTWFTRFNTSKTVNTDKLATWERNEQNIKDKPQAQLNLFLNPKQTGKTSRQSSTQTISFHQKINQTRCNSSVSTKNLRDWIWNTSHKKTISCLSDKKSNWR